MNNKEIFDQTGFISLSADKLSRRDYFAGQALMGFLASSDGVESLNDVIPFLGNIVSNSVWVADKIINKLDNTPVK